MPNIYTKNEHMQTYTHICKLCKIYKYVHKHMKIYKNIPNICKINTNIHIKKQTHIYKTYTRKYTKLNKKNTQTYTNIYTEHKKYAPKTKKICKHVKHIH